MLIYKQIVYLLFLAIIITAPIDRYHTYNEIKEKLELWDNEYGNLSSSSEIIYELSEIGSSSLLGLPFWMVKISKRANIDEDEPRILILGQCHAEEILGVELSMQLIECLLDPSTTTCYNNTLKNYVEPFLENTEIYIVPTHNPEGLSMVHGTEYNGQFIQDSSYRKNMTDANLNGVFDYDNTVDAGGDLDGVDLNRNYDFNWEFGDPLGVYDYGSCNSSYTSDFDYYKGASPESEIETQTITNLALEKKFLLSVAYHSSRSGCVSEKVIYPWLWDDNKKSPDFDIIEELGQNIASLIPKEIENNSYEARNSISRKGNAHDWFYKATGTFQYLIELGTSNLQPSDPDIIDDTIERNLRGLFYMISRSFGLGYGIYGVDDNYLISGIVKSDNMIVEHANVIIKELHSSVHDPRTVDKFGKYRRLLVPGSYTLITSAFGFVSDTTSFIASSSGNYIDINLDKLDKYEISLSSSIYPTEILVQHIDWDTTFVINQPEAIELPKGMYNLVGRHSSACPIATTIELLNSNISKDLIFYDKVELVSESFDQYTGTWNEVGDNDSFLWSINNGILQSPTEQETGFYPKNISSQFRGPEFIYTSNNRSTYVVDISIQYQTEWDHDYLALNIVKIDGTIIDNIFELSGHGEITNGIYNIEFPLDIIDGTTLYPEIQLTTDSSVEYGGVLIDHITINNQSTDLLSISDNMDSPEFPMIDIDVFPNPFNSLTNIVLENSYPELISVKLYDARGSYIKTILNNKFINNSKHIITVDMAGLSAGLYLLNFESDNIQLTKKILFLK